jgi:N-acetylglucosaminyldiphosphoundecaprenol N-acetyl-beta-D-mannosaminyltransferase
MTVSACDSINRPTNFIAKPMSSIVYEFDDCDLVEFLKLAASYGDHQYGYVVTPNADHLIRFHEDAEFRNLYARAAYVLLDSRFLSHVMRVTRGIKAKVCTGSDLTAYLFETKIAPDDCVVMIGGNEEQATALAAKYGLRNLCHHNPPMGFVRDPLAVETCLRFIENNSPFRFCFLAIGSPQQEVIARALGERGQARGLALCIGASINFLTGIEKRAPKWMQTLGIEWAYRLLQDPGRMAKRYLVRGPRVFVLLLRSKIVIRASNQM